MSDSSLDQKCNKVQRLKSEYEHKIEAVINDLYLPPYFELWSNEIKIDGKLDFPTLNKVNNIVQEYYVKLRDTMTGSTT
jgi:hypothetical protein